MTTMLVIDASARSLETFVANVTKAEAGLVVRAALELPSLDVLAKGHGWQQPLPTGMPVLLLGDGYQAQSSAGFVSVVYGNMTERKPVTVVGLMPFDRPLLNIRPKIGRILPAGRLVADRTHGSSNWNSAAAAAAGIGILMAADQRAVVLAEGQSDWTNVYRILPEDPAAEWYRGFDTRGIEEEHLGGRFTREGVVVSMVNHLSRREDWSREGALAEVRRRLGLDEEGVSHDYKKMCMEEAQHAGYGRPGMWVSPKRADEAFHYWGEDGRAAAYAAAVAAGSEE